MVNTAFETQENIIAEICMWQSDQPRFLIVFKMCKENNFLNLILHFLSHIPTSSTPPPTFRNCFVVKQEGNCIPRQDAHYKVLHTQSIMVLPT